MMTMIIIIMMMNCFYRMTDQRKAYFYPRPHSEFLTIANLGHTASKF